MMAQNTRAKDRKFKKMFKLVKRNLENIIPEKAIPQNVPKVKN